MFYETLFVRGHMSWSCELALSANNFLASEPEETQVEAPS
jgi:hypothetical protein